MLIGVLLICSIRPLKGLLNIIMAGLGSPAPIGVDPICNKARLISWLVSVPFLIMHFTNLMHAST